MWQVTLHGLGYQDAHQAEAHQAASEPTDSGIAKLVEKQVAWSDQTAGRPSLRFGNLPGDCSLQPGRSLCKCLKGLQHEGCPPLRVPGKFRHTLGLASGARGEKHVGQAAAGSLTGRCSLGLAENDVQVLADAHHLSQTTHRVRRDHPGSSWRRNFPNALHADVSKGGSMDSTHTAKAVRALPSMCNYLRR